MLRRPYRFKRGRTPPPAKTILIITFILFIIFIFISIWFIDKGIEPTLMDIAEIKTDEFATRAINAAVEFTEQIEFEDLMNIQMNNEGNVARMGWNSAVVNKVLRKSTDRVEYFLHNMNKGETIDTENPELIPEDYGDSVSDLAQRDPTVVEIPIGQATGNTILANLGPKIPVHFEIVGNIKTDVTHEVKEWGVNAALYEVYINVQVNVQIVVPFSTKTSKVETKIFIDSGIVMGEVPEFFNKGDGGASISIPKGNLKKAD